MVTNTKESALEACIERHLTGGTTENVPSGYLAAGSEVYQTSKGAGYLRGKSTDFNTEFAIDEAKFWQFLESTQAAELAKVDGKSTYFLPFNKGLHNGQGKGNPVNPNGHKSAYLWQEILTRHSLSNINERFFSAWDATPEEQRVKLIKIMEHVQESAAYKAQVVDNPDEQNRRIALESLITQAVNKERKKDLDLYKVYAGDPDFKKAFDESIMRILELQAAKKSA